MKYTYSIKLDKQKDLWNWLDVIESGESYGLNWRDKLKSEDDIKMYDKMVKTPKDKRKAELSKYLDKKYIDIKSKIESYLKYVNNIYAESFDAACNKLVEITKKDLFINDYKVYITTFPRCPYNYGKGYFFTRLNNINPLGTFLHEVLHFQFHNLWQSDPESSVSKLSDHDFNYLKESLTVILDEELFPIISQADQGYESHQEFRKILHENWKANHDFDKLVEFGLQRLPEFANNQI